MDKTESLQRNKILYKFERMILVLMTTAVKTTSAEESVPPTAEVVQQLSGPVTHGVNVCGVRSVMSRNSLGRKVVHDWFIIHRAGLYVLRRYQDFRKLRSDLQEEFPGIEVPPLPDKNKERTTKKPSSGDDSSSGTSSAGPQQAVTASFPREKNRLSLRAFLSATLLDSQLGHSKSMMDFLDRDPIEPTPQDLHDIEKRSQLDEARTTEQIRFAEIAKQRADELSAHMTSFRQDLMQKNGLSRLFHEVKIKEKLSDLPEDYQKVIEWARIEMAVVIYHLFVAQDSSAETFSQAQRIHSMIPYTPLKYVLRFSNPMAMMRGVIDLFLAQPLGSKSLMQRILSLTLNDDIRDLQKSIDVLRTRINDNKLCDKLMAFSIADAVTQEEIQREAVQDDTELVVAVLRSELIEPALTRDQIMRVYNANKSWNSPTDNSPDLHLYLWFEYLLKLYARQKDKKQLLDLLFEGVTSSLLKDIITIFYEPLATIYKNAAVWNSVGDLQAFVDDLITVVRNAEEAQHDDPSLLVQSFIDLVGRHADAFYSFVHRIHVHDKAGLFTRLMEWIENILRLLREGLPDRVDLDALLETVPGLDKPKVVAEINQLVRWNADRKAWVERRRRDRIISAQPHAFGGLRVSDFGLDEEDVGELIDDDEIGDTIIDTKNDDTDEMIERQVHEKKSKSDEPQKPVIVELVKAVEPFRDFYLRQALAV